MEEGVLGSGLTAAKGVAGGAAAGKVFGNAGSEVVAGDIDGETAGKIGKVALLGKGPLTALTGSSSTAAEPPMTVAGEVEEGRLLFAGPTTSSFVGEEVGVKFNSKGGGFQLTARTEVVTAAGGCRGGCDRLEVWWLEVEAILRLLWLMVEGHLHTKCLIICLTWVCKPKSLLIVVLLWMANVVPMGHLRRRLWLLFNRLLFYGAHRRGLGP